MLAPPPPKECNRAQAYEYIVKKNYENMMPSCYKEKKKHTERNTAYASPDTQKAENTLAF